jgi:hypothetical protein
MRTPTRAALLAVATLAPACRRAPAPARDTRLACERALGIWRGDDVEAPRPDPEALAIGRRVVREQRWVISPAVLEMHEPGGRHTSEAVRVVLDAPARCDVELSLGDQRRRLTWEPLPDGRMRVRATGHPVAMVLRRE